jgi:hypothetical protein
MITHEEIHRQSYEERDAWLASLNDDEKAIVSCPVGHRWTLVVISETKRFLSMDISAEHRLRCLEFLDRLDFLTAEAITVIEPMSDEAYEMVKRGEKARRQQGARHLCSLGSFQCIHCAQPFDLDRNKNAARISLQKERLTMIIIHENKTHQATATNAEMTRQSAVAAAAQDPRRDWFPRWREGRPAQDHRFARAGKHAGVVRRDQSHRRACRRIETFKRDEAEVWCNRRLSRPRAPPCLDRLGLSHVVQWLR